MVTAPPAIGHVADVGLIVAPKHVFAGPYLSLMGLIGVSGGHGGGCDGPESRSVVTFPRTRELVGQRGIRLFFSLTLVPGVAGMPGCGVFVGMHAVQRAGRMDRRTSESSWQINARSAVIRGKEMGTARTLLSIYI
uniref:Uncharacterized protein n=1 Tax=Pristionchus pacificus TaxID=54126 RepID=A0A2A6D2T6_PRIPA|eukprot:PDM84690.1 hypothetical protein PRIPAC_33713 [Pristionchus pacificus]